MSSSEIPITAPAQWMRMWPDGINACNKMLDLVDEAFRELKRMKILKDELQRERDELINVLNEVTLRNQELERSDGPSHVRSDGPSHGYNLRKRKK